MIDSYLLRHDAHNYEVLCNRWRDLVEKAGWRMQVLWEDEYPVYVIESGVSSSRGRDDGIYLSAGIHGDECAPVQALLEWMEVNYAQFDTVPLLLFPCLNPWGLVENRRSNSNGIDLNRNFHNREIPLIAAWQDFVSERKFQFAGCLHEDYDARGIYLYQLGGGACEGEELLRGCETVIPREMRSEMDGNPMNRGVLYRQGDIRALVESDLGGAYPETIYLSLGYADCAITFESPSEFSLSDRVAVHRSFLDHAVLPRLAE